MNGARDVPVRAFELRFVFVFVTPALLTCVLRYSVYDFLPTAPVMERVFMVMVAADMLRREVIREE